MSKEQKPFEEIALNRNELKMLKKSEKSPISLDSCQRLNTLNLVDEVLLMNPGYAPNHTGTAVITDRGIDYLAYVKRRNSEYRSTRRLAIIALIISILSLIAQVAISLWL